MLQALGIDTNTPNVDFATGARGFGVHSDGLIEKAEDVQPAIQRAAEYVGNEGELALVHVITTHQPHSVALLVRRT
jgi:thiamine pyrophosphate-dependent acetolactate synthase large subunit-like protein